MTISFYNKQVPIYIIIKFSDSDSDTDSEEEEKWSGRRKRKKNRRKVKKHKKNKKQNKVQYEELTEWKEADDIKWESEEIRLDDNDDDDDKWYYKINNLRDATPYAIRIRGRNISGWGNYSTPQNLKHQKCR